jgi:Fe-S cluster assembly protein SufD
VQQKQDSLVTLKNFSAGGLFARDEIAASLQESGANCRTQGFYHLRNACQYIDNHIDIDHIAPHSQSTMLYKGILNHKSRAVFNGRLHVHANAQKIVAHQANHNILLSNDAEIYTKPELEIYADDVKCKHGATVGQLDQDALFYLRSRGIPEAEAIQLLLEGFAEEIMQEITHLGIRIRVNEMVA